MTKFKIFGLVSLMVSLVGCGTVPATVNAFKTGGGSNVTIVSTGGTGGIIGKAIILEKANCTGGDCTAMSVFTGNTTKNNTLTALAGSMPASVAATIVAQKRGRNVAPTTTITTTTTGGTATGGEGGNSNATGGTATGGEGGNSNATGGTGNGGSGGNVSDSGNSSSSADCNSAQAAINAATTTTPADPHLVSGCGNDGSHN